VEADLSPTAFREVLVSSGLGSRRPVDDAVRLNLMLRQADLVLTARNGLELIGVARAVTDFSYCCYLSDLAVSQAFQRQGIGRHLIEMTHRLAGHATTLVLIAAPAAEDYYQHIGMQHAPRCWVRPRDG
jgi:GNAT superfamily N-acetyltransferase